MIGIAVKCKNCGRENQIRLKKGVKISKIPCYGCGHYAYKRNSEFDKSIASKTTGDDQP